MNKNQERGDPTAKHRLNILKAEINEANSLNKRPYCPGSFRKITERKLESGLGNQRFWDVVGIHRLAPAGTAEFEGTLQTQGC